MGCCEAVESYPKPTSIKQVSPQQVFEESSSPLLRTRDLIKGTQLFESGEYSKAAKIFRGYIEEHADEDPGEIDGIGQTELSLGYYEWFLYRHYKEGIEKKKYIGTAYDALALCYLALKKDDD